MREYRRVLFDGHPSVVTRVGERLQAKDGRSVAVDEAIHLPPTEPRKIICVHLNYMSRVDEFMTKLPATPTRDRSGNRGRGRRHSGIAIRSCFAQLETVCTLDDGSANPRLRPAPQTP